MLKHRGQGRTPHENCYFRRGHPTIKTHLQLPRLPLWQHTNKKILWVLHRITSPWRSPILWPTIFLTPNNKTSNNNCSRSRDEPPAWFFTRETFCNRSGSADLFGIELKNRCWCAPDDSLFRTGWIIQEFGQADGWISPMDAAAADGVWWEHLAPAALDKVF